MSSRVTMPVIADVRPGNTRYFVDNKELALTAAAVPVPTAEGSLAISDATLKYIELLYPGAAGYALVTDGSTANWSQTPPWTGRHSFAAGIAMTGASAANDLVVPDDVQKAFELEDAAGLEYLTLDTRNVQPAVNFNLGGSDVDFNVAASGVPDALQVRGADGQITLGALGTGLVKSTAGVLSIAAAADLPAHTHAGAGEGGTVAHSVTTGQTTDDHHAEVHVVNSTGPHAEAGLTIGHVLRATGAAAFSFGALIASDLPVHTHAGAGQGGSLVIGTTDTDATAGSLLFAGVGGAIQENNARLFWNSANNRLGVGTTTPDGRLHVHTASAGAVTADPLADDLVVESGGQGGLSILTPDANVGNIIFGTPARAQGAWMFWDRTLLRMRVAPLTPNGTLELGSNNNIVRLTLEASGNILLDPTATLDLNGIAGALILDAAGTLTLGAPTPRQLDIKSTGSLDLQLESTAAGAVIDINLQDSGQLWIIRKNAADDLLIRDDTGGANPFRIDAGAPINSLRISSGGQVGVGASSSAAKLYVDQFSSTAALPVLTLDQADISEEMINFIVAATGAGNPVDTATAVGTLYARLRVAVNGTFKYIQLYNA